MKNLFFFKNIITQKKKGGAMIVLMLVFFVIFILAFGSGYLVFLNTSKSVDVSNGIKARYAALAGKDRALYEAIKNNYDFVGVCSDNEFYEVFYEEIGDGSSYSINCVNNAGDKTFYSVGKYKNVEISLEIDCININKDCSESCKTGSICGGGKLLKTDTYALSISPSGCDASGANCDNKFLTADTVSFQWDTTAPFQCGTSTVSYGGKTYNTISFGTQCWFKQNLDYNDGCASNTWTNGVDKRWCGCYNDTAANCTTYGRLYQWSAAMASSTTAGAQGVCPSGWHIPTSVEANALKSTISGNSAYSCGGDSTYISKAMATNSGWTSHSGTCTTGNTQSTNNASGFSAMPGGNRNYVYGQYVYLGGDSTFWTSSLTNGSGLAGVITYWQPNYIVTQLHQASAYFVRCLKDSSGGGSSFVYNGADNLDNGKTNNTTLAPQIKTHLEAAKYCDDLVVNGYSDWYLPATNELLALYNSKSFSYFNLQSVGGDDYWVSTEQGSATPTMAGYIKMSTGVSSNADKASEFKVRCVRKDTSCSSKTVCGSTCDYGGEEYETIQIGSQCWFKRNLNIGSMINSSVAQANNSVTEKYCYVNNASNCVAHGGLYQWNEAMQYSTSDGAQGLCPSGWHLPKDSDWTSLTNYLSANSQYWCSANSVYLAKSLSSVSGWNASSYSCRPGNLPANNNSTGFSAIPGGRFYSSGFGNLGTENYLWTSTTDSAKAWLRIIGNSSQRVSRSSVDKNYALTIRCLKD